jgi:hypothetical protein
MVESPLFAKYEIERALAYPSGIEGLVSLVRECHVALADCNLEYHKRRILEKVERGDWLLVTDRPFKSVSGIDLERCSRFKHHAVVCTTERTASSGCQSIYGPGKWVTKDIEYDLAKNALSFTLNWLSARGDEGRLFLSDGKDYANTFREVIQEWQPLMDGQGHVREKSISHYYGELRRIRQQYVEADDHWPISGSSWHWRPVTADSVYEIKGE